MTATNEIVDHTKTRENGYLGNVNVKRDGVAEQWTEEKIIEYNKCRKDPVYFTEKYCKVINLDRGLVPFNLYPYQKEMFKRFINNRFNIVLACRQSGKSISCCAYLLWYALFHSEKTVAILANKGTTAREMLERITLMLENLPFFLQPGCKTLNKGNVDFTNNSKIVARATSGSSIRSMSVSLLYLDEFAFVEKADVFYTSTYPVITSGKSTKVIITSTANGIGNTFHKIWTNALQNEKTGSDLEVYRPFRVDWWNVPGRDERWKEETIANTSKLQFDQEFGNCVSKDSKVIVETNGEFYEIKIGQLYDIFNSNIGYSNEDQVEMYGERIQTIWVTYKITKEDTGEFYIGKTSLDRWDSGYMGSGVVIQKLVKKYGKDSFDRNILSYHIKEEEAYLCEEQILGECMSDEKCLNISPGGIGVGSGEQHPNYGKTMSDHQKNLLSESLRGRRKTKEAIQNYKKSWTPERRKIQAALVSSRTGTMKGKKHKEASKKLISAAVSGENNPFFGKSHSIEIRQKISEAKRGVPQSIESNQKRSMTQKGKPLEKIACPHCQKVGGISQMKRWHFDNCRKMK